MFKRFAVVLAVLAFTGCSGSVPAAVTPVAVDVADFACSEMAKEWQNEPGWVKFVCTVVTLMGDGSSSTPAPASGVVVKVPVDQAVTFRARHALPVAGKAPPTASGGSGR